MKREYTMPFIWFAAALLTLLLVVTFSKEAPKPTLNQMNVQGQQR